MALIFRAIAGGLLVVLALTGLEFAEVQNRFDPLVRPGDRYTAPFAHAERLRYEVYWKPLFLLPAFKAGELDFRTEETTYQKRPVYKVMAEVRSSGRLADVAGLDVRDYFESIFDRETFRSYRLVKKIREGKRQRDFELLFDYPGDRLQLREEDVTVQPARQLKNLTIPNIDEPLADVVSVFYVGRLRAMETGDKYFINLVDEGDSKRIEFSVAKTETIKTPIGSFSAIRINTNGRIFNKGGNLRVWYSTDASRIPVKFEADVAFGKVYGALIGMDTLHSSRGLVKSAKK